MGFTDSGHLITIGASTGAVVWTILLLAFLAYFVHRDTGWSGLLVSSVFALLTAFVLAYYLGDKIVFGPAYVRETVWFREVGHVEWRHVESASLAQRSAWASDGSTYMALHLVLKLRTKDEWTLEVEGMEVARRERLLAFAKERIARR